jgi:hypothetical protein
MVAFYDEKRSDIFTPPRSIFIRNGPKDRKLLSRTFGKNKVYDKSFSMALEARGFYVDQEVNVWRGPSGITFWCPFVETEHSRDLVDSILKAIDFGAKTLTISKRKSKYIVKVT